MEVNIRVEFGEYMIENGVEKGSPKRNRSTTAILLSPCVSYSLSLTSLSSELGLGVFMNIVDMDVRFH